MTVVGLGLGSVNLTLNLVECRKGSKKFDKEGALKGMRANEYKSRLSFLKV